MEGEIFHIEKLADPDKCVPFWQITIRVELPPLNIQLGACEIHNIEEKQEVKKDDKAYYG